MLHRHSAHNEAVARIGWCVAERRIGVITGEVGAGKTVAVRAALAPSTAAVTPSSICLTPPSGARHPPPHRRLTRRATLTHHATLAPGRRRARRRTGRTRTHPSRGRRGAHLLATTN
ncbi:putative general secretion pathway protein [Mycobacterium xenopi 4042]|uniref:Putative general secretion pathway protein n=1 Tax=Mycobacterium xenopi 4042 TaxID=1299334 RepID=X8DBU7_MYCXE|nr:putative general secretion pathway protein [Mycobacterium xenopi 4042]